MSAQTIAKILLALRRWERDNAPIPNSSIASEIVYLVASRSSRNPLQVKDIYLALGYSEARTSEVLRELVAKGWLNLRPGPTDRRTKIVQASRRSLLLLGSLRSGKILDEMKASFVAGDVETEFEGEIGSGSAQSGTPCTPTN